MTTVCNCGFTSHSRETWTLRSRFRRITPFLNTFGPTSAAVPRTRAISRVQSSAIVQHVRQKIRDRCLSTGRRNRAVGTQLVARHSTSERTGVRLSLPPPVVTSCFFVHLRLSSSPSARAPRPHRPLFCFRRAASPSLSLVPSTLLRTSFSHLPSFLRLSSRPFFPTLGTYLVHQTSFNFRLCASRVRTRLSFLLRLPAYRCDPAFWSQWMWQRSIRRDSVLEIFMCEYCCVCKVFWPLRKFVERVIRVERFWIKWRNVAFAF